jgi:hypothetical protein
MVWHTVCIDNCEEPIFIKLKEMKKLIITSVLAVLAALTTTAGAQNYPKEYLGLPGDNLNLYAVMDLFRNSSTLEAFERGLNDRDSRINNLDLNGDYRIDYITVSDYVDGRVHNIVLRALLGRNEYQDVAVITVEKIHRKKVMIQIIGDAALYGRNYIIEPVYTNSHKIKYYKDPLYYGDVTVINYYYGDVWNWPVIAYIFDPYYRGWSSSWYWGYYPSYWHSWNPWYWDYYYGYHSGWEPHYHSYYHHSNVYRYNHYNDFYYNHVRQQSENVQHRIAEGNYRQTYSRPEQRSEGTALYNSTHAARVSGTRDQAEVNTGSRRETASRPTGSTAPASGTATRRPATGSATVDNSAARTETDRRKPSAVNVVTESKSNNGDERTESRRSTSATVSREATSGNTTAKTEERRQAETREAEARAAESRAAESRAAEARAAESRAAEARAAEARAAESRAAESRAAEARAAESRAAEARAAEARAAESRAAEARAARDRETQAREAQSRAAEARTVQQKAAEQKAAAEKRSEDTRTKKSETGTEKPARR